jgi:hypothetical protein
LQLRKEEEAQMSLILDGSGRPTEPTDNLGSWRKRWGTGKKWSEAIWTSLGGIGAGAVAICAWITAGETIKKFVLGDPVTPSSYTSGMSDEEATKIISLAEKGAGPTGEAASDVRGVLLDVPAVAHNSVSARAALVREEPNAAPPSTNRPVNSGPVLKRQSARPVLPPIVEPIEVTSITYDDKRQLLDVIFRNTTDQTVVISQFVVTMTLVHETSAVEVSGTHDLGPLARAARWARDRRRPFTFRIGFNVAYKVEANGVDRHMFKWDLNPKDLYVPAKGEHYVISVYVKANKYQVVRDRRFVRMDGNRMYLEPTR